MDPRNRRRSALRLIGASLVVIALAFASYGCGANIPRGKIIFSKDVPTADGKCSPANAVTSVSTKDSVYATYVFKSKPGSETLSISVTKDGQPLVPKTDIPTSNTSGQDCLGDTDPYNNLQGWGVGTYHVSINNGDAVVAEGDLTVK
jgi:hypothetical protein